MCVAAFSDMDLKILVDFVRQTPQLWDRNCPEFRDKDGKERAWLEIGRRVGQNPTHCKDTFKSLREKYLREREKTHHHPHHDRWQLLHDLQFLDPHIVPRAATWQNSPCADDTSTSSDDPTDFDRQLIGLVKKALPIWDRNCNTYPNKHSKHQLWEQIAQGLGRDVNCCMLRWKALREKYIRQRAKFLEGEPKWEMLDELAFLDKVIQYRRKVDEESDWSVKQEPDSSYTSKRPRSPSLSSESDKRAREEDKNPEQLFGDLVASLLAKKPECQRSLYMIEIMTVLSK